MFNIEDLRAEVRQTFRNSPIARAVAVRCNVMAGSVFAAQAYIDQDAEIERLVNLVLRHIKDMADEFGPPTRPLDTLHKVFIAGNSYARIGFVRNQLGLF